MVPSYALSRYLFGKCFGSCDRNNWTTCSLNKMQFNAFLQHASVPVYQQIWNSMKRILKHDPDILSTNHTLHMHKVDTDRYVYIVDVTSIRAEMATNCHMTMLNLRFMPLPYSIGFHNNTAYKQLVNEA